MKQFNEAVKSLYNTMEDIANMIYEDDSVKAYFVENYGYEEHDYVVFLLLEYMKDIYFN